MVIQRWQSILLLIVAVVMACFTFCTLAELNFAEETLSLSTLGFRIDEGPSAPGASEFVVYTWPLFTVSLLSVLIPALNIFMFKNMKLQKTLCLIELLFLLAIIVMGWIYAYYYAPGVQEVAWSSIAIAPLLAFVADIMAYNRISHDQRLLRAADRLR